MEKKPNLRVSDEDWIKVILMGAFMFCTIFGTMIVVEIGEAFAEAHPSVVVLT